MRGISLLAENRLASQEGLHVISSSVIYIECAVVGQDNGGMEKTAR